MRVFAIFFHPGSNFTAVGGAEKRFLQVLKVWERKGIETTIVETRPKLVSTCCPSFEEIEIGYPASSAGKGLYSIYLEWALWVAQACLSCPRIVKRNRQDLILAPNNTLPNLFVAYFVHVLSRVPLAVTVHHFDFPEFQKRANVASTYRVYKETGFSNPIALIKALTFSAMLAFVRRSDVCITVSNFTAEFLMKNGISQDKIRVSGNGVDTALIERFKAEKKVYDGIFVGRISRDKGIFDLVQIWKRVTALKPDSKLVVVGQGPDSLSLKRTVEDNGMSSNIMLKGRCNDAELYAHMKASKVFLFPSRFEGWGLAVGEALACGLPAVCYGISALREVFGKCSSVFFIPTGDTVQFAETVGNILNEDNLPELETASKEYAKHFSWEKVALNDLQIIRTVSRY